MPRARPGRLRHRLRATPASGSGERLLCWGGAYSNLEATAAVLDAARTLGVPADRVVCTGDVVAYCAAAAETVALVREAGCPVVQGNCEEAVGDAAESCGCGFEEGSKCDRLSVSWYAHAVRAVDDDARAWMRALPRTLRFDVGGARVVVTHASGTSNSEFVFASSPPLERKAADAEALGADVVVAGHSGIPFTQKLPGGALWHNAGVVGMPANDGTARCWYSLLEPLEGGGVRVRHLKLEYDYGPTQAKMVADGLPPEYREALASGLWPSLDVLPPDEAAATGVALDLSEEFEWRPEPQAAGSVSSLS